MKISGPQLETGSPARIVTPLQSLIATCRAWGTVAEAAAEHHCIACCTGLALRHRFRRPCYRQPSGFDSQRACNADSIKARHSGRLSRQDVLDMCRERGRESSSNRDRLALRPPVQVHSRRSRILPILLDILTAVAQLGWRLLGAGSCWGWTCWWTRNPSAGQMSTMPDAVSDD